MYPAKRHSRKKKLGEEKRENQGKQHTDKENNKYPSHDSPKLRKRQAVLVKGVAGWGKNSGRGPGVGRGERRTQQIIKLDRAFL